MGLSVGQKMLAEFCYHLHLRLQIPAQKCYWAETSWVSAGRKLIAVAIGDILRTFAIVDRLVVVGGTTSDCRFEGKILETSHAKDGIEGVVAWTWSCATAREEQVAAEHLEIAATTVDEPLIATGTG